MYKGPGLGRYVTISTFIVDCTIHRGRQMPPEPMPCLLLNLKAVIPRLASEMISMLQDYASNKLTFCILSTMYSLSAAFESEYVLSSNLATISLTRPCCSS